MSRGQKSRIFLTSHVDFLFIFGQCGDNYKLNLFLKRKVGVTERSRSLKPIKALAMATCPIIVHFSTKRARSMHDVAREFACAVRMRSNNWRERPGHAILSNFSSDQMVKFTAMITLHFHLQPQYKYGSWVRIPLKP